MNGLYKRVLKGQFPPVDKSYSSELVKVVAALLRTDHNLRPSCAQILDMDFVQSKCRELGIDLDDDESILAESRSQ